ncbi:B3 domain-containing protein, partial [Klebsiella pneumoniae]|uniref:B3 domain-containing protein n=1 Tax=Klebsiella pneumoniae TaxID=573 RepID=UPI001BDFFA9A
QFIFQHIPISFVRSARLDGIESILIEDTFQKVWKFKLDRGTRYTNGTRRVKLRKNWRKFFEANNLRFNQKCLFELDPI